jgi:hypothetical protein
MAENFLDIMLLEYAGESSKVHNLPESIALIEFLKRPTEKSVTMSQQLPSKPYSMLRSCGNVPPLQYAALTVSLCGSVTHLQAQEEYVRLLACSCYRRSTTLSRSC